MSIPAIDFNALNVVSITRGLTIGETVVRYNIDGKYDKFYLTCNNEEHNALAIRFQKFLDERDSK